MKNPAVKTARHLNVGDVFLYSLADSRGRRIKDLLKFLIFAVGVAILCSAGSAWAVEKQKKGDEILRDTYSGISAKLKQNSFGFPLYVESLNQDGRFDVDVYGIVDHPFSSVLRALESPSNWCDIACLHPNIKACTHRQLSDTWLLTFYSGRKTYQPPEDSRQYTYRYRTIEERQGFVDIVLSSDEGPFGTKDHRMRVEAAQLNEGRTLVHVSYSCRHGFSLRVAEEIYFSTLGRGKVGFTVSGTDSDGNPVYVGGPRGAIERNAVRYYFAIQSFMDTLRYPEEKRFHMMISEWYDLTDRYRKQLYEMDKKDYLTFKTAEHRNQVMLQQRLSMNVQ